MIFVTKFSRKISFLVMSFSKKKFLHLVNDTSKKIKFVDDNDKGLLVELKAVVFYLNRKLFLNILR